MIYRMTESSRRKTGIPDLELSVLGPVQLISNGRRIDADLSSEALTLLAYLVLESNEAHTETTLGALLWPELPSEEAQLALQQAVADLQQATRLPDNSDGEEMGGWLQCAGGNCTLNPALEIATDIDSFCQLMAAENDPDAWQQGADLYRGEFLPDLTLPASLPIGEWVGAQREEFRRIFLDGTDRLADVYLDREAFEEAQSVAWKQLKANDVHEPAYQHLMVALAESGQTSAALAQYQLCRRLLQDRLNTDPSPETTALYRRVAAQVEPLASIPEGADIALPIFMFTDIEGSTPLWDEYREDMLPALLQHNIILEECISEVGGRILELRGDGVKAVFEDVDPLPAAIKIQKRFGEADWGEVGEIRIRLGLHGVPSVQAGHDYFQKDGKYFGSALNHAARITDAGWGGQILVSELIHDAFPPPPGAKWQDFGWHRLRELDEPVHIYGLLSPDLPHQTFPPLRTVAAVAEATARLMINFPVYAVPFVGRERELAALEEMLHEGKSRLVTITAPGGMGKSRLAVALAERMARHDIEPDSHRHYTDGIYFVPLHQVREPDQLIPAIANALRLPIDYSGSAPPSGDHDAAPTELRTPRQQLLDFLQRKQCLLVLDGFEHLTPVAGILSEILQAAPGVTLVVSSRQRLQLQEETVYAIQGLEINGSGRRIEPASSPAAQLFLVSARRVVSGFELKEEDMPAMAQICRFVDGMPLGLELAAAWVDTLPVAAIAAELRDSVDMLESDLRNVPDRQRSIRTIFDYAWQQIGESEQHIFLKLALFRSGLSRRAVQFITGASLRILSALVSKSLIYYDKERDRYHIHELLRQYAIQKLAHSQELETKTRDRHSLYYCRALDNLYPQMIGAERQQALTQLRADIHNVQSAWKWAVQQKQIDRLGQALKPLCQYYMWENRPQEGEHLCRKVADLLADLEQENVTLTGEEHRVVAFAGIWQGVFNLMMGETTLGATLLYEHEAALVALAAEGIDTRLERAFASGQIGLQETHQQRYQSAERRFMESLELSRELEFPWGKAQALMWLGDFEQHKGNYEAAKERYQQCLELARIIGNPWLLSNALRALGWVARAMVNYDEARRLYEESAALCQLQGDRRGVAESLRSLSALATFHGNFGEAVKHHEQSLRFYRDIGDETGIAIALFGLGTVHWLAGDSAQSLQYLRNGSQIIQQRRDPFHQALMQQGIATVLVQQGHYELGQVEAQRSMAISRELSLHYLIGRCQWLLGWIALAQQQDEQAYDWFHASIANFELVGAEEHVSWGLAAVAIAAFRLDKLDEAWRSLHESLEVALSIRSFIPLLFNIPAAALLLVENGETMAGVTLYALASTHPFVSKSKLHADTMGRFVAQTARSLSASEIAAARRKGEAMDWWQAARQAAATVANHIQP
jgi:predicted ATPase/DNA-binding SARP family transcriptional activator